LSDIGETLAARFTLEDKLIQLAAEAWQQAQPDEALDQAR
ncbi:MAG: Rsd/AlgQ family anti-sigma factor, partial [Serratia liquefaciens]|nr:Rsd/AlgQ family anti-sigma factor [Serratia liquefaciens]